MNQILSNRSRSKFNYNGYTFGFHKYDSTRTVKFWRCDKRDSDSCKVRIHTCVNSDEVLKQINNHSHGSDAAEVEVMKIRTSVKRQAENTQETTAVILNNAYQNLPLSIKGKMPNHYALKKKFKENASKLTILLHNLKMLLIWLYLQTMQNMIMALL